MKILEEGGGFFKDSEIKLFIFYLFRGAEAYSESSRATSMEIFLRKELTAENG